MKPGTEMNDEMREKKLARARARRLAERRRIEADYELQATLNSRFRRAIQMGQSLNMSVKIDSLNTSGSSSLASAQRP